MQQLAAFERVVRCCCFATGLVLTENSVVYAVITSFLCTHSPLKIIDEGAPRRIILQDSSSLLLLISHLKKVRRVFRRCCDHAYRIRIMHLKAFQGVTTTLEDCLIRSFHLSFSKEISYYTCDTPVSVYCSSYLICAGTPHWRISGHQPAGTPLFATLLKSALVAPTR